MNRIYAKMLKMKHRKLIIGIIIGLLFIGLCAYDALVISPHKLTIREETLTSSKLDESFDDFIIAYFSDLHYANYTNDDDLDKLVETINSIDPDLVLFSGDLVDHYATNIINDEQKAYLINKLSEIDAKIAKYAVLGNHDLDMPVIKELTTSILEAGGFSLITNTNRQVSNGTNNYINIVGIDCLINQEKDIESAYKDIDNAYYTIAMAHCPDSFLDIKYELTDYMLAGHCHGGQIYIPLINRLYRPIGCKKYFRGKYHKNSVTLDITNGVGLTNKPVRFLSDAEVVFYKLKSE